jgi:Flp pilus assembly protein TadD
MTKHKLDAATLNALAEDLRRLERLVEVRDEAAEALANDLAARARKLGIQSPCLTWLRGIVADLGGNLLQAFQLIEEALSVDPIAPPFHQSRGVVLRRLREFLCGLREPGDPQTLTLWETLARAGAADDGCHLALARHHVAKGNDAQALLVLDAVTTLSPACAEAWALKATVATRLGDQQLAARCTAEAAALGQAPAPFGSPVVAEG